MLQRKIVSIISILLLSLCSLSMQAESGEGTYRFLNLPYSARLAGLGGDNVSVQTGDVNQIYVNPALFTKELRNTISLSYVNYLDDANGGMASYAYTKDSLNYFGFNFLFMTYGELMGYDEYGAQQEEFSAGDFAWNLVYARYLGAGIKVGVSMKPIYSHIGTYTSAGLGFDVGANYYKEEWDFSVGLVARNFGFRFKGYYNDQDRERLPWNLQIGLSKGLLHAPFRFSVTYDYLNKWSMDYERMAVLGDDGLTREVPKIKGGDMFFRHLTFGLEAIFKKYFYIEMAYNHRRNREYILSNARAINGFSFGAGFKVYKFSLDAAYAQYGPSGGTFTLTLSSCIDSFKKQ